VEAIESGASFATGTLGLIDWKCFVADTPEARSRAENDSIDETMLRVTLRRTCEDGCMVKEFGPASIFRVHFSRVVFSYDRTHERILS